MIKGNEWDGFLGWKENDGSKREEIRQKCQSSVYYWLPCCCCCFVCVLVRELCVDLIGFFLNKCKVTQRASCMFSLFGKAVLFFFCCFSTCKWCRFSSVRTKTGLPALLKQLPQLETVNSRHRDTALTQSHNITQRGRENPQIFSWRCHRGVQDGVACLDGLCSQGSTLKGQVLCSVGWRFGWRWLSVAALWQWDNKNGGESLYPWQHMSESEHWILLSLSDSQRSSQCGSSAVFLWCAEALQSQRHYFRKFWGSNLHKMKGCANKNQCL